MPFLASEGCFWPLTASMTSEVKINYAYLITQGICNKFIEIKFSVWFGRDANYSKIQTAIQIII